MKVITLCGSMRFFNEMQEIAKELELRYAQKHKKEIIFHSILC